MGWADYFDKLKADGTISYGDGKDEDAPKVDPQKVYSDWGPVRITQEAEEFDDPIPTLAAWVKLANANGWEILSLAHALSFAEGLPYLSGAKEGVKRGDREIEVQWAHFRKGKDRASVLYTLINGKTYGAQTARLFNGEAQGDADMKRKMKE